MWTWREQHELVGEWCSTENIVVSRNFMQIAGKLANSWKRIKFASIITRPNVISSKKQLPNESAFMEIRFIIIMIIPIEN